MQDISIWQFPLSFILSLIFMTGSYLIWRYLPECKLRNVLSGKIFCSASIFAVLVLTAVEGTWGFAMHRNPAMWVASLLMMLSLLFVVLDSIKHKRGVAGLLCHLGMFLIVFGAFWGAPDIVDVQMVISTDKEERDAFSMDGKIVPLPFAIRLTEFHTDYYDDGVSPKQYTSTIEIDGKKLKTYVNHPCLYKGYRIYQSDYDRINGAYSVIKLVRDPWLPIVFIGMILLVVGSFLGLGGLWNRRYLFVVVFAVAVLFTVISVARINFGTLMPALRSFWFIPHLVLYMIAYSSLTLAIVTAAISYAKGKEKFFVMSEKLFSTASSLLLLGMLCGAVWAKAAWGDWWTWDAKECWAAVTWLFTLLGTHIPVKSSRKKIITIFFIILSFIAMQMAWYGVESLPASVTSMHAYK